MPPGAGQVLSTNLLQFYFRETIHFEAQTWPVDRVLDLLVSTSINWDILPKDTNNQDYVKIRIIGECYDGEIEVDVLLHNHQLDDTQKNELQDLAFRKFPTSRDAHNWNKRKRLADAIRRKCK